MNAIGTKRNMEFFYSVEPKEAKVSKEEFEKFVSSYPRRLDLDISGISEPPSVMFNDVELAKRCPFSVVAHTWKYSDDPDDYAYVPEENRRYYIVENYEEIFSSKTWNKA